MASSRSAPGVRIVTETLRVTRASGGPKVSRISSGSSVATESSCTTARVPSTRRIWVRLALLPATGGTLTSSLEKIPSGACGMQGSIFTVILSLSEAKDLAPARQRQHPLSRVRSVAALPQDDNTLRLTTAQDDNPCPRLDTGPPGGHNGR